jgi:phosphatidylglycerol:prolipoprotein diacylglycerol transferase
MIPVVFRLGPIPLYSFGLMMLCCFLSAWNRLYLSLKHKGESPELAEGMIFWAAIGGIFGARINYLFSFPEEFLRDPIRAIFNGAGFVYYGGFIGGVLGVWWFIRKNAPGKSFLYFADLSAPALALGYAVGRIGCHLSGDGDYGVPTTLAWGFQYVLGIVPSPAGVFVHPTPIYETLGGLLITAILLNLQERKDGFFSKRVGALFSIYILLSAIARFCVEFVRAEPLREWGLTEAQIVSVILICLGGVLFVYSGQKPLVRKNV